MRTPISMACACEFRDFVCDFFWRLWICDVTHSFVWCAFEWSWVRATWLICMSDVTLNSRLVCVAWLISACHVLLPTCAHQSPWSRTRWRPSLCISQYSARFCGYTGLGCKGLFCRYTGLFFRDTGLFPIGCDGRWALHIAIICRVLRLCLRVQVELDTWLVKFRLSSCWKMNSTQVYTGLFCRYTELFCG